MSRRIAIVLAAVAFLAISLELARYLTAAGAERSAVLGLLAAQARGDSADVIKRIDGCAADVACTAKMRALTARLRHAGHAKILLLESQSAYRLKSTTGVTRVAWTVLNPAGPTIVQCLKVHKHWTFLGGASTSLRSISAPIGLEAGCPGQ